MSIFKKGNVPWNKGLKGIHLSPKSEFKSGVHSTTFKGYGREAIYHRTKRKIVEVYTTIPEKIIVFNNRDKKFNYSRKRISYAKYIWTKNKGNIPKGFIVYHIDKNPLNNDIKNLKLITRAELLKLNNEEYMI